MCLRTTNISFILKPLYIGVFAMLLHMYLATMRSLNAIRCYYLRTMVTICRGRWRCAVLCCVASCNVEISYRCSINGRHLMVSCMKPHSCIVINTFCKMFIALRLVLLCIEITAKKRQKHIFAWRKGNVASSADLNQGFSSGALLYDSKFCSWIKGFMIIETSYHWRMTQFSHGICPNRELVLYVGRQVFTLRTTGFQMFWKN